jgi:aspartokinase/homoserine dehydrogenase 1
VGVVGGTLLEQIRVQHQTLIDHNNIEVRVIGIARSSGFITDEHGIDLGNYATRLASAPKGELTQFVEQILELNLRNSVFVDNTANQEVTQFYKRLLNHNVSVVTPNKIANAAPYEQYRELHRAASKYGVQFLYETNVGAGLPIINTLQDMITSGDTVERIEAILSGSLNYIFSQLAQGQTLSQAVADAKTLGYTEPDPRQDLSGTDVARKILILSREVGATLNLDQVIIQSLIGPESCQAPTPEAFWNSLLTTDEPKIAAQVTQAAAQGQRLKYIARYENGQASTSIEAVGPTHPFFNVAGSDNIIAFTTRRYRTNPLIVVGPGAGADVTAAGVFADIIRIINH